LRQNIDCNLLSYKYNKATLKGFKVPSFSQHKLDWCSTNKYRIDKKMCFRW